jgi:hypothetical protein
VFGLPTMCCQPGVLHEEGKNRYPLIADALGSLNVSSIVVDGEAVWCASDGYSN